MAAFLKARNYNNRKTPVQLLERIRRAPAGRAGEVETATRRQIVLALVATLQMMVAQIADLDAQITRGLDAHPDGEIFRSFFRSPNSVICAATLLAEIGDSRARYPHRDAIAADAGHAPVAVESGKRKSATFRWACNHRLRNALAVLAHASKLWNPWAADRYAHARARGHNHRRALRTLGRAISRIIWQCWQNHTPYDPQRHTGLQQHITVTIPSRAGSRPDLRATQQIPGPTLIPSPNPSPVDTGRLRRHPGTFGEMAASGGMRHLGRERCRREASVSIQLVEVTKASVGLVSGRLPALSRESARAGASGPWRKGSAPA